MEKPLYQVKTYGRQNKRIIFLLGGWRSYQWMMWPASKMLELSGYQCITYSFSQNILTPDIKQSINQANAVKRDIVRRIKSLRNKDHEDFSIFGTSFGALISLLVANDSNDISKVIFNTPGTDLAESMWSWDKIFPQFKQELIQRYSSLNNLKQEVAPIDPVQNVNGLRNKDVLVYISAKDDIVVCSESKLKQVFRSHRARFKLNVNYSF